jgi:hypothetical protein
MRPPHGPDHVLSAFQWAITKIKLAELSDDKYKVVWEPQAIVFADGTKLVAPEN